MAGEAPIEHDSSWPVVSLAEIAIKIGSGATPKGGADAYIPTRERYALVRSQNVFDRRFDYSGLAFITDKQAEGLRSVVLQPDDILLNITGDGITFGRACMVPNEVLPACVNQHVSIIRVDSRRADAGYVLGFLTHPTVKSYIESFNAGGSRRAITKGHIESFRLPLPPLAHQRAIAHILGTLDDKIELNRRMNETLEAMARALFKSWFVDFDPVRAKAESRDTGLPKHIADLFPDSFEDSEMGEIPKGWEARSIYETAEFINGAAFKSGDFCDPRLGLPIVKIAELKDGIGTQTKFSGRVLDPKQVIDTGELLYSWSGSPDTSLDAFLWTKGRGLLNQHIFKVTTPTIAEKRFVYYLLKFLKPTLVEIARNKQTTGLGHVTVADMKRLYVCSPAQNVLAAFDSQVGPLFDKVFKGMVQNQTVAALRDAILPKLISDELRVGQVSGEVESVI